MTDYYIPAVLGSPIARSYLLPRTGPSVAHSGWVSPLGLVSQHLRGSCLQNVPEFQAGTEQTFRDHASVKTVSSISTLDIWIQYSKIESITDVEQTVTRSLFGMKLCGSSSSTPSMLFPSLACCAMEEIISTSRAVEDVPFVIVVVSSYCPPDPL